MTSSRFNERKAQAEAEMAIYDGLPAAVRAAIDNARGSIKASSARDALLRGVPEQAIIDTINNSKFVITKPPQGNGVKI